MPDQKQNANKVKIREFVVDLKRHLITGPKGETHIEPRVTQLLAELIMRRDEVLSRSELIDRVWNVEHGADESLTRAVSQLRKAFGDSRGNPKFIETVPKGGYRFVAPVEPFPRAPTGKSLGRAPAVAVGSATKMASRFQYPKTIIAFITIAIVAGIIILTNHATRNHPAPERSVAVIPFVNISSNTEDEYFVDGLSEEIIDDLTKIDNIRVAGRTSSFQYKGRNEDLRKVATELGVAHILEGSVRRSGDRLRITVQLVKADDGFHLWSETYDRSLDDIFAIQEDIAKRVAGAMRVSILGEEQALLTSHTSDNAEIETLFLTARAKYRARGIDNLISAEKQFREVLDRQPDHAEAAAGYVLTLRQQHIRYMYTYWRNYVEKSELILASALQLSPNNASVRAANAQLLADKAIFESGTRMTVRLMPLFEAHAIDPDVLAMAESEAQTAVALDPTMVEALETLAFVKLMRRQSPIEVILDLYQRAIIVDPLSRNAWMGMGDAYFIFGQFDQSRASYEKVVKLHEDFAPGHAVLGDLELLTPGKEPRLDLFLKHREVALRYSDDINQRWMTSIMWYEFDNADKAIEIISRYEGPEYPSRFRDALIAFYRGDYKRMTDLHVEQFEFSDDHGWATYAVALLANEGRYNEAGQIIRETFPGLLGAGDPLIDWNNIRVLPYAAEYLRRNNDALGAAQLCNDALSYLENQDAFLQVYYWSARFLCYANMNQYDEAVFELKSAIDRGQQFSYSIVTLPTSGVPLYDADYLGALRETKGFQEQIDRIRAAHKTALERYLAAQETSDQ